MSNWSHTLHDELAHQREMQWEREGVASADIALARTTGIDARDIDVLRRCSRQGWLLVVRCPKPGAYAYHGLFPPKKFDVLTKSGPSGLVVATTTKSELRRQPPLSPQDLQALQAQRYANASGPIMVSDYDLMCIWQIARDGWRKLPVSAPGGRARGPYSPEATALLRRLNMELVSRLQHGCQDDFLSPSNPGVKPGDHFAAFHSGRVEVLAHPQACAQFYQRMGLPWPYDAGGRLRLDE